VNPYGPQNDPIEPTRAKGRMVRIVIWTLAMWAAVAVKTTNHDGCWYADNVAGWQCEGETE
jgi:hypothetical protein